MKDESGWNDIQHNNLEENTANKPREMYKKLTKNDLPLNEDGSLSVFWYDAHEEQKQDGHVDIYVFGKTMGKDGNYKSVALQIRNLSRVMFAVPKEQTGDLKNV